MPRESRGAFDILYEQHLLDDVLWKQCSKMVGFRNLAIHEYEKLELDVIQNGLKCNGSKHEIVHPPYARDPP